MIEDMMYNLSLTKCWYNNTKLDLYANTAGVVYTKTKIKKGTFIGYIIGEKAYTWDVPANKYCIWLNDYFVLDCRKIPRCITSMIRRTMGDELSNCTLSFAFGNDTIDVYIIATCDIEEHTELVVLYDTMDEFL
jgi:hypothetical protein